MEEAIRSGYEKSPLEEVKGGLVLGGEEFLEEIRARIEGDAREQPGLKEISQALRFEDIVQLVSNHKGGVGMSTPTAGETGAETWSFCSQKSIP